MKRDENDGRADKGWGNFSSFFLKKNPGRNLKIKSSSSQINIF